MDENDGLIVEESGPPHPPPPPAAPAPEPPAPAEPVPEGTEPVADSAPAAPDEDTTPIPRGIQRRIDTLTRRNYEYQRELDMLKGTVQALQKPPAPEPPAPPGRPVRPRSEDYPSPEAFFAAEDAYIEAVADYRAEQRLQAFQAEQAAKAQEQAHQQTQAELDAAIRAREAALVQTHPDYYEQCAALMPQMAPTVRWALQQAGEDAPDLVLHLASHPEDVAKLNTTPPHLLGLHLGKLRGSANGTTAPPAAPAPRGAPPPAKPEPPTPVAGGGRTTSPGYREDMSQAEFEAWWARTSRRK